MSVLANVVLCGVVRKFSALDEAATNHTIAQALAIYPVEEVCLSLLTPALTAIGGLWAGRLLPGHERLRRRAHHPPAPHARRPSMYAASDAKERA